ncbi:MAG: hypothetical protein ACLGIK_14675 [Gemmatimonadota bacterium]
MSGATSGGAQAVRAPCDDDWGEARTLVLRHGWNAVAYQILNPGMRRWFSQDGDAVAGYVEIAGVWG